MKFVAFAHIFELTLIKQTTLNKQESNHKINAVNDLVDIFVHSLI